VRAGIPARKPDLVEPHLGFARFGQLNAGFGVVEHRLGVAEERPGHFLPGVLVHHGRVGVGELAHVVARTAAVPVFHRTLARVEAEIAGGLARRVGDLVLAGLDLVGGVFGATAGGRGFQGAPSSGQQRQQQGQRYTFQLIHVHGG
jgi:hypothetical protein